MKLNPRFKLLNSRFKKGFTLIELLVVISIIGILVAVGATSYQRAVRLSRDSKRKTDLEQIRQALETYRSQMGSYPDDSTWEADLKSGYISDLPIDPKAPTTNYFYKTPLSPATTYKLCATLEIPPVPPMSDTDCPGNNYKVVNP